MPACSEPSVVSSTYSNELRCTAQLPSILELSDNVEGTKPSPTEDERRPRQRKNHAGNVVFFGYETVWLERTRKYRAMFNKMLRKFATNKHGDQFIFNAQEPKGWFIISREDWMYFQRKFSVFFMQKLTDELHANQPKTYHKVLPEYAVHASDLMSVVTSHGDPAGDQATLLLGWHDARFFLDLASKHPELQKLAQSTNKTQTNIDDKQAEPVDTEKANTEKKSAQSDEASEESCKEPKTTKAQAPKAKQNRPTILVEVTPEHVLDAFDNYLGCLKQFNKRDREEKYDANGDPVELPPKKRGKMPKNKKTAKPRMRATVGTALPTVSPAHLEAFQQKLRSNPNPPPTPNPPAVGRSWPYPTDGQLGHPPTQSCICPKHGLVVAHAPVAEGQPSAAINPQPNRSVVNTTPNGSDPHTPKTQPTGPVTATPPTLPEATSATPPAWTPQEIIGGNIMWTVPCMPPQTVRCVPEQWAWSIPQPPTSSPAPAAFPTCTQSTPQYVFGQQAPVMAPSPQPQPVASLCHVPTQQQLPRNLSQDLEIGGGYSAVGHDYQQLVMPDTGFLEGEQGDTDFQDGMVFADELAEWSALLCPESDM